MKILAIVGSPRKNGNTYKIIKQIEQRFAEKKNVPEFEYVQLSETKLENCKGCYLCLDRGEENCPLKDGRENIEQKIKQADAVIFASPVYTYNVSGIMKNFLDRFAYRCHRPDFYGKKAMVVVSTGAVGLVFVETILSFMIGTMGFITCAKAGLAYAPLHEKDEKKTMKQVKKLNEQVDLFYSKIINQKTVKPSFLKLITFKMQQKAFSKAPDSSADFKFWKDKGWLQKNEEYYYKVQVGNTKKLLVSIVYKMIG